MATQPPRSRPLSPHLTAWKWGPHMLVSILHRATGDGMATIGTVLFVWWLAALAGGEARYAGFVDTFTTSNGNLNILGYVFGIGLTLAFFQHLASGVRHLVMDTGAGFQLKTNKTFAVLTMLVSVLATIVFWAYLLGGK
ncbi:succinate dehydrogenase, cytochrome b556 subunit [Sphingomonas koreensis]|nr:succinate dehydrogenase, cytochrome b556 subunit [Sphingomonas koreensis]